MSPRRALIVEHVLDIVLGVAVIALVQVLPGAHHHRVGGTGLSQFVIVMFVVGSIMQLLSGKRKEEPPARVSWWLKCSAAVALVAYLMSWLAGTFAPLGFVGAVLIVVGAEGLVGLAIGRVTPIARPSGRGEKDDRERWWHAWPLAVFLGALLSGAAAYGNRIPWWPFVVCALAFAGWVIKLLAEDEQLDPAAPPRD
jgi:hypothetical protein